MRGGQPLHDRGPLRGARVVVQPSPLPLPLPLPLSLPLTLTLTRAPSAEAYEAWFVATIALILERLHPTQACSLVITPCARGRLLHPAHMLAGYHPMHRWPSSTRRTDASRARAVRGCPRPPSATSARVR